MGSRGPKPQYERLSEGRRGAPQMSLRLDPPLYEHVKQQPDGPRPYLERLIREDMARGEGSTENKA